MVIVIGIAFYVWLWWALLKKTYYVRIDSYGTNKEAMIQALKTELEITLQQATVITDNIPYNIVAGGYFNYRNLKKVIQAHGGQAHYVHHWPWEKPEAGQIGMTAKQRATNDQVHNMGGIHFSSEDALQVYNMKANPNAAAYDKMAQAMAVSAQYMHDKVFGEDTRIDDVYPTTYEETQKMDALLDASERAVVNHGDAFYNKMLTELRGIVGWSNSRHYSFSWLILFGSFISIMGALYLYYNTKSPYESRKLEYSLVKSWGTDKVIDTEGKGYITLYESLDDYKRHTLDKKRDFTERERMSSEHYANEAANATDKKEQKKFEKLADKYAKEYKQDAKELEGMEDRTDDDWKKAARKETRFQYRRAARAFHWSVILLIYVFAIIPVYIYANHSWGYNITRFREEHKMLEKIRRTTYVFAASMVGAAFVELANMEPDKEIIIHWSDGTTTKRTELSDSGFAQLAMAAIFILIATIVIGLVSTLIMTYSSIVGLKRNYDWTNEKAKVKELLGR